MYNEEVERSILEIITSASESISFLDKAFQASKTGDYAQCEEYFDSSDNAMRNAHAIQTELIQKEVNGERTEPSLFMVHAQDHMMNVFLMKQVVRYLVEMQCEINQLKEQLKGGEE